MFPEYQIFLLFAPSKTDRLAVNKTLGRDTVRIADQDDQKAVPYHRTSCSTKKSDKKEQGRAYVIEVFVFQSNHYTY